MAADGRRGRELDLVFGILGLVGLVPEMRRHELNQGLAHEARLSGSRYAGDRGEHAERKVDVDVLADYCGVTPVSRSQPRGVRGACRTVSVTE